MDARATRRDHRGSGTRFLRAFIRRSPARAARHQAGIAEAADARPGARSRGAPGGELTADHFERLPDRRVALRFDFVALFHTERLVEDFRFEPVGDELALGDPLGKSGLDVML